MSKPSIVGVGLHRTGTRSLSEALKILGYTSSHWEDNALQLMEHYKKGNVRALLYDAQNYDAVSDTPFCLIFRELYQAFPDAKYILTLRRNPQKWLASLLRHVQTMKSWKEFQDVLATIYGEKPVGQNQQRFLYYYENHNDAVRHVIPNVLEVCWENGDGWPELCSFLGHPKIPNEPFPHFNKTSE